MKLFARTLVIGYLSLLGSAVCLKAQGPADFCVYRRGATLGGFEFTVARDGQVPGAEWLPPIACHLTFAAASAMRDTLKAGQASKDFCVYRRGTTLGGFDFTVARNAQAPGAEWLPPLVCNLTFAAASAMRDAFKAAQTTGDFCVYRRGTTQDNFEFTVARNGQAPGAEWLPPLACNLSFAAASTMRDALKAAQTTGDFCVYRRGTALGGFEFTVALCSQPPGPEWLPPIASSLSFTAAFALVNSLRGGSPGGPGSACNGTFRAGDGSLYHLNVAGGTVTGTYEGAPGPHSGIRGTIRGTISGNTVSARYEVSEGQVTGTGVMTLTCGGGGTIGVSWRDSNGHTGSTPNSPPPTSPPPTTRPPGPPTPPTLPPTGGQTCAAAEQTAFSKMSGSWHEYRMNISISGSCGNATGTFKNTEFCEGVDTTYNSATVRVYGTFSGRMQGGSLIVNYQEAPHPEAPQGRKGSGSCTPSSDGSFSCDFGCRSTFKK